MVEFSELKITYNVKSPSPKSTRNYSRREDQLCA
jgi:hypothetical protein